MDANRLIAQCNLMYREFQVLLDSKGKAWLIQDFEWVISKSFALVLASSNELCISFSLKEPADDLLFMALPVRVVDEEGVLMLGYRNQYIKYTFDSLKNWNK